MLLSLAATSVTLSTSDIFGVSKTPQTQSPLIFISLHIFQEFIIATHSDKKALYIFASVGQVGVVKESQIDAVASVSGASPAYVYLFIEALADGAVMLGLSREEAYRFASQAVVGAAKMVQQTGEHPAKLKDAVCSPGGTTIEAIAKLEEKGFRSAIIEAMRANDQKAKKMKQ